MTRPDHPSGSDRVYEALAQVDPRRRHDAVVNLQGDLPTIDPAVDPSRARPARRFRGRYRHAGRADHEAHERDRPERGQGGLSPRAGRRAGSRPLFQPRAAPVGRRSLFHHIGIYAYRRAALDRFVALPPGPIEQRERLEQLRALENGMRIDATLVDTVPLRRRHPGRSRTGPRHPDGDEAS